MTPEQTSALERLRGGEVAWPPMFEVDAGAVVVVLVLSFEMTTASWASYTPDNVWLQSVRIDPDGTETIVGETTMRRITP